MTTTMVTLEEVLAAAGGRRAALAPETSGYLALAIGDATSRLPLCIEDRGVSLTTEGTVLVPRKGELVAPAEAAKALRETLARLLAVSAGSMPGLASAARPRAERDVDGVVAGIEAALIPVNRGAARRALARLARETLRAKELGKLPAPPKVAAPPAAEPAVLAPAAIAPPPAAAPAPALEAAPAVTLEERALPAPEPEAAAALPLAPVEVIHLTGIGLEVLFAESAKPPAIEPSAPAPQASAPAELEPAIEAAPVPASSEELVAAELDAGTIDVELSSFEEEEEIAVAVREEAAQVEAARVEAAARAEPFAVAALEPTASLEPEHATSIDATAMVRMEAAARAFELDEDDGSIPPPRETTPTLLGIGDVGVYVAAAMAPEESAPAIVEAGDEDEPDATTAALPLVRLKGATPRASLAEEPVQALEPRAFAERPASDFELTVVPSGVVENELSAEPALAAEPEPALAAEPALAEAPAAEPVIAEEPVLAASTALASEPDAAPAPLAAEPSSAAAPPLRRAELSRAPAQARPRGQAELAPSTQSSVDDLLARFNVAGVRGEQRVARALKSYAGIELTAAPPVVWESPRPSTSALAEPPASSSGWESSPPPVSVRSRASRVAVAISAALLALGLAGTGMLWHLRPDLFGGSSVLRGAPDRPAPPAPPREPHAAIDEP